MSEHYLALIPKTQTFALDSARMAKAKKLFALILPPADETKSVVSDRK
jgi:hypothetical protein